MYKNFKEIIILNKYELLKKNINDFIEEKKNICHEKSSIKSG